MTGVERPETMPAVADAEPASPEAVYRARQARFQSDVRRTATLSRTISAARLLTFALAAVCLVTWGRAPASSRAVWLGAAGGAAAVFVALLFVHEHVIRALQRAEALRRTNQDALARLRYDWSSAPLPETPAEWKPDLVARDLGLFGRASLFQLLGTLTTPPGRTTLARWLLEPAPADEIRERQQCVRVLAGALDFRQGWQADGAGAPELGTFLAWAEATPWLSRQAWLPPVACALAVATPLSLAAAFVDVLPGGVALMLVLANLLLSLRVVGRIHAAYSQVSARKGQLGRYAALLRLAEDHGRGWHIPKLNRLAGTLTADGRSAAHQLQRLDRLVSLSELRLVPFFYFPLQLVFLWDVVLFLRFESWQRGVGPRVKGWIDALGEIEALSTLGALSFENPLWSFPEPALAGTGPMLRAESLGHPLIAPAVRVTNDVQLGQPGSYMLLTGSNMSGKSTLLRTIGLNVALAQAGGPVCAASLSLAPVRLGTSVVVEDSLADGVSFFLAELRRLKAIVDLSRRTAQQDGRTLLFLLDEILRGTNSAERRLAVREVLLHLLAQGAGGVVSTHDLGLVDIPELHSAAAIFHFRETIGRDGDADVMTFDYRLRPGVATTSNAMRLLDLVGLRFAPDAAPHTRSPVPALDHEAG